MLDWAKKIEAQRAQTTVLSTITELRQFNKVKVIKKAKEDNTRCPPGSNSTVTPMQILWWITCTKAVSSIWQDIVARPGISKRYAKAEKTGL